jgi:carboxylesterase
VRALPLDPEKTAPFELGDGKDACLLIHGFTGSPWDMRPLGETLAASGYHAKGICLPGHGGSPEALEKVTYRDWEAAAEDGLSQLSGFRRVFVAGLSMGSLLGVLLASRRRPPPHALALLAPAMRFRGPHLWALRKLRDLPVLDIFRPFIRKTGTDIEDPASRREAPVLAGFPSARLYDVWTLQDRARQMLNRVRIPVLIAVAQHDHVVSAQGARELARGLKNAPRVDWLELAEGFHIIPRDRAAQTLAKKVLGFFEETPVEQPVAW